jgi:spermidine synthase
LLVDSWSSGDPDRAGTAYAVNIAGCIVGPLLAGFWLLPWLGERWAIVVLTIPLFAIATLTALRKPSEMAQPKPGLNPKLKFALATVGAILLVSLGHDYETKFAEREVRRDFAATVIATGKGFDRELLVNGYGMTVLTPITKYIAHLPLAFMSRPPRNGLVICFGMGTSFRSMLSWGIPTTTVDLIPSVPPMFGYYHADASKVVSSPLARIVIDDGRRFLDGSTETYDVIVVDPPPPPQAAGSSLLYSREFYEVVKKHLRKDGILQTWLLEDLDDATTTVSVAKALTQSFPYVRAFPSYYRCGIHFLASMEPLPITASSVLASRMPSAAAADLVEWGPETSPQKQFDLVISHELSLKNLIAADPRIPALQDDQPINEYFLQRRKLHSYR